MSIVGTPPLDMVLSIKTVKLHITAGRKRTDLVNNYAPMCSLYWSADNKLSNSLESETFILTIHPSP